MRKRTQRGRQLSLFWICFFISSYRSSSTSVWNIKKLRRNFAYRPAPTWYYWSTEISVIFRKYHRYFCIYRYFYRFFGKFPDISYQSSSRTGYKICPFFFYFKKKQIRCCLVIWSWFAGKGCAFSVKFKSSGMDFHGNQTRMHFPGNQMGDGFSWESNGGCKKNKLITWLD